MAQSFDSIGFIPPKLQELQLYPKLREMMNFVIDGFYTEFADILDQTTNPPNLTNDVIEEIIKDLGFSYISDVMATITGFEFQKITSFIGLINLLKGSRDGVVLVLRLIGLDAVLQEWWEFTPQQEPHTYVITVVMDTSIVDDPILTLEKVQVFLRAYVYPTINNVDFRFTFAFASKNVNFGGFHRASYAGKLVSNI